MGFSVSASAAIIFAAMFIAFGMFYTASANSAEMVNDARVAAEDDLLTQQNTAIEITDAVYNTTTDRLTVTVNNTGGTQLTLSDTDLLADNRYQSEFVRRSVNGDEMTGLWLPGEQLRYVVEVSNQPDRVKVVAGSGVAATEVVRRG
ncbi:MAG: flagellin [archaeon]